MRISHSSRCETVGAEKTGPGRVTELGDNLSSRGTGSTAQVTVERRHAVNRRGIGWRAFLYGNFRPRRRFSRREADQHQVLFDWHEPRILYLALSVLLLSCTDALFTLNLLEAGATEANTLMASMLDRGMNHFLAFKIGITAISVVILVTAARRRLFRTLIVEHLLQIFCAGYFLLICYQVYMLVYVFELVVLPGR